MIAVESNETNILQGDLSLNSLVLFFLGTRVQRDLPCVCDEAGDFECLLNLHGAWSLH